MNTADVYGSFAQALFFSGTVTIPKYLLLHYADIGLSDQELMLVLHILSELDSDPYPPASLLSERMHTTTAVIEGVLGQLIERRLLSVERHWDPERQAWRHSYSMVGLINELAERWAIEQFRQLEADKAQQEKTNLVRSTPVAKPETKSLLRTFENELGRALSEMESEYIKRWLDANYAPELIIEALRRSVSVGVRTFRYIDSILREWDKKGLRTLTEVEADDAYFHDRKARQTGNKSRRKVTADKYEDFYL